MCIVLLEVQFTGVKEATHYAGLVYYEEKGKEDLVTFTAAKKLNALLEVTHYNSSLIYYSYLYSLLRKNTLKLNKDLMLTSVLHLLMVLLNWI